ncbi:transcription factor TFIIIC subunit tfc4 [Recurvomyces mirabilis]|nr:transcription factor TFIIIC subunit tfc4 [Recurvomyces mirabilis]
MVNGHDVTMDDVTGDGNHAAGVDADSALMNPGSYSDSFMPSHVPMPASNSSLSGDYDTFGDGYAYDDPYTYTMGDEMVAGDDLPYFRPVLGSDGEPLVDESGDPVLAADEDLEYDDDYEEGDGVIMDSLSPTPTGGNAYSAVAAPRTDNVETPPSTSSGLAALLANASSYWSKTSNLGFGDGAKQKARLQAMSEVERLRIPQGAPMESDFHVPDEEGEEEALLQALDARASDQGMRSRGRGSGRPRGRGGFRWALRGTSHDPALKRQERGRGRGRGRGGWKRRGRPRGVLTADPGREFKRLQTEAMAAYMDGNHEAALTSALEAIHKNPEVGIAHWLVSEALRGLGREKDSIGALMSGAVVDRDAKMWTDAGDRTMRLAETVTSRFAAANQALYCYSHAMELTKKDPALDLLARLGIRDAYLETGDLGKARLYSKSVCTLDPTDWDNLVLYAELCADTQESTEMARAKVAYEVAFEATSKQQRELGDVPEIWSHVNIYLELLDKLKYTAEAIRMLKRLARWILGRKEENFWDQYNDDDREFDSGNDRRGYVGEFQQGKASVDKSRYGDGLPIDIRVKLGLFRVKMGTEYREEAMKHLEIIYGLREDAAEHYDTFYAVADCLRLHGRFDDAMKFYQSLKDVMDGTTEDFALGIAECYEASARNEEAEETYKSVLRDHPSSVKARIMLSRLYRELGWHQDAEPLLREVLILGKREMVRADDNDTPALPRPKVTKRLAPKAPSDGTLPVQAHQRFNPRTKRPYVQRKTKAKSNGSEHESTPDSTGRGYESSRKATAPPTGEDAARVPLYLLDQTSTFEKLAALWETSEADPDSKGISNAWVRLAADTTDLLRTEGAFFLNAGGKFHGYGKRRYTTYHEEESQAAFEMLSQSGVSTGLHKPTPTNSMRYLMVPNDFQNVDFHKWHRLIVQLCLCYADRGDQVRCYDVLTEVLLRANIFNETAFREINSTVALLCALKFNDSKYANDIVRDFALRSEFRASVPYQLINGVSNLCYGEENAFSAGPSQKYLARGVKAMDYNFLPPALREQQEYGEQLPGLETRFAKHGQEIGPPDAGVLIIYGNVLAMTSLRNAALPYYLRALALQPDNAMLHLSIGISYIHQGMKRQTENRQYTIQQGISFVQRYHELRTDGGDVPYTQEAEYNMAKVWHMLGLTHLAIPGYEKVLALSDQISGETALDDYAIKADFAKEAAYALQQLFALAGNQEAAAAITEQWLVI